MPEPDKRRIKKRREHRLYYAATAFRYKPRPWTGAEDRLVMEHSIPDRELSTEIQRSMKSISNRRWRLKKEGFTVQ